MSDQGRPVSFDPPRERRAPTTLRAQSSSGESVEVPLNGLTLIVGVKPDCDGCRPFIEEPLSEFDGIDLFVVSAVDTNWANARRVVYYAPEFLAALELHWPPSYVLIDARSPRVVTEGVVFSPAQVAHEISSYLR